MTNKEKYPRAHVSSVFFSYGRRYYVTLDDKPYGSTYLVNGQPNTDCTLGWHETYEQAENALKKFMNPKPEITLAEIKSHYAEAQKLIGKTVKCETPFEVATVTLEVEHCASSMLCDRFFKANGYVIKLASSNGGWVIPYTPDLKSSNAVEVFAHDGQKYTAESDGDCWKFGCAKISKSLVREACQLFEKSTVGNRKLEKITIGKCDFDYEILKQLTELDG